MLSRVSVQPIYFIHIDWIPKMDGWAIPKQAVCHTLYEIDTIVCVLKR